MSRSGLPDEWTRARRDLDRFSASTDFRAAADELHSRWPHHAPDYFRFTSETRRYRVRRAFDDGDGWAARLTMSVGSIAHFSLHAHHLGLPCSAAASRLLFDRETIARWRTAIAAHFRGPLRWKLELGDGGRIHAHVLADIGDGPPELPRGGRIVRPCGDYLEAVVGYLCKPPLEYTAEGLAIWLEARAGGRRLPQLSGVMGIPSSLRTLQPKPADISAPPTPDAAPSPDAPDAAAPQFPTGPAVGQIAQLTRPELPRPLGLLGRPSRPLSPSQNLRFFLCLISAHTAPPARSEAAAGPTPYPVRRTGHCAPPRARGPPERASDRPQPLDLSPGRNHHDRRTTHHRPRGPYLEPPQPLPQGREQPHCCRDRRVPQPPRARPEPLRC